MFALVIFLGLFILQPMALFSKNKKKLFHDGAIFWSKCLLRISRIKVVVKGLENIPDTRPLVIMPNHQGHWDYIALFSTLPLRFSFIIKKELFNVPFFGKWLRIAGYFPLDRCHLLSRKNH